MKCYTRQLDFLRVVVICSKQTKYSSPNLRPWTYLEYVVTDAEDYYDHPQSVPAWQWRISFPRKKQFQQSISKTPETQFFTSTRESNTSPSTAWLSFLIMQSQSHSRRYWRALSSHYYDDARITGVTLRLLLDASCDPWITRTTNRSAQWLPS